MYAVLITVLTVLASSVAKCIHKYMWITYLLLPVQVRMYT